MKFALLIAFTAGTLATTGIVAQAKGSGGVAGSDSISLNDRGLAPLKKKNKTKAAASSTSDKQRKKNKQ